MNRKVLKSVTMAILLHLALADTLSPPEKAIIKDRAHNNMNQVKQNLQEFGENVATLEKAQDNMEQVKENLEEFGQNVKQLVQNTTAPDAEILDAEVLDADAVPEEFNPSPVESKQPLIAAPMRAPATEPIIEDPIEIKQPDETLMKKIEDIEKAISIREEKEFLKNDVKEKHQRDFLSRVMSDTPSMISISLAAFAAGASYIFTGYDTQSVSGSELSYIKDLKDKGDTDAKLLWDKHVELFDKMEELKKQKFLTKYDKFMVGIYIVYGGFLGAGSLYYLQKLIRVKHYYGGRVRTFVTLVGGGVMSAITGTLGYAAILQGGKSPFYQWMLFSEGAGGAMFGSMISDVVVNKMKNLYLGRDYIKSFFSTESPEEYRKRMQKDLLQIKLMDEESHPWGDNANLVGRIHQFIPVVIATGLSGLGSYLVFFVNSASSKWINGIDINFMNELYEKEPTLATQNTLLKDVNEFRENVTQFKVKHKHNFTLKHYAYKFIMGGMIGQALAEFVAGLADFEPDHKNVVRVMGFLWGAQTNVMSRMVSRWNYVNEIFDAGGWAVVGDKVADAFVYVTESWVEPYVEKIALPQEESEKAF